MFSFARCHFEAYGIKHVMHHYRENECTQLTQHPFNPNYTCHWKDLLISSEVIDSSQLCFQEDDALIFSILNFPNAVTNWSLWGTISLYATKFMCSISAPALNLFRGVTFTRNTTKTEDLPDVKNFARQINHPSPSVSNVQTRLPALKFENVTYHVSEILFHIKLVKKTKESLRYTFNNTTRFPVVAGIDEQEINPGTYVINNELCGLEKKMSAADVMNVGLNNLGKHIAEVNNFLTHVREYRLVDFAGIFCSNILTTFGAHALDNEKCTSELNDMMKMARACERCLKNGLKCKYERIDSPCDNCILSGTHCFSLIVFHNSWDMGSSHKKSAKLNPNVLNPSSSENDMMDPKKCTVGFGGLHLAKAVINMSRNYVLQYEGEYFGVNMLISLRNQSELLQSIKNAVFVAKDRQSDYLGYLTVSKTVQQALQRLNQYSMQRIPEQFLTYKPNAATQKKIIYPVAIVNNRNGDVFILDATASCIHVVDCCSVAAVHIIGRYGKPNLHSYPKNVSNMTKKLRLSNSICDLSVDEEDNICVCDPDRKEVILIPHCLRAKKSCNTKFYVARVKGVLSAFLCYAAMEIYVLRRKRSGLLVQLMVLGKAKRKDIRLEYKVMLKIRLSYEIEKIFFVPSEGYFGSLGADKLVRIHHHSQGSTRRAVDTNLNLKSSCKPYVSREGTLLTSFSGNILSHELICDTSVTTTNMSSKPVDGLVMCLCINGKVTSAAIMVQNSFRLYQLGPLGYAIKFCDALEKFYYAVGYVPPVGNRKMQQQCLLLQESVDKAQECGNLLEDMQAKAEERTPGRKSFRGLDGMPFTETVECISDTIKSWQTIIKRCEMLEESSSSKIHAPSITSEKDVEHSFGYIMKKGQGNNQSQEEYIISKRKHVIDFQMRKCKMPFSQYTKDSIQDKGYQQIEGDRCSLSKEELDEIFFIKNEEDCMEEAKVQSSEEAIILKKAFLLSKSVPRQTNRTKWRERSGFGPNMLVEQSTNGKLCMGDLVCSKTSDGYDFLIVEEETLLCTNDLTIGLKRVCDGEKISMNVESLVVEKGHIMALPCNLYEVKQEEVIFTTSAAKSFQKILLQRLEDPEEQVTMTDDDWALLLEDY